jgi:hypothetical protein
MIPLNSDTTSVASIDGLKRYPRNAPHFELKITQIACRIHDFDISPIINDEKLEILADFGKYRRREAQLRKRRAHFFATVAERVAT